MATASNYTPVITNPDLVEQTKNSTPFRPPITTVLTISKQSNDIYRSKPSTPPPIAISIKPTTNSPLSTPPASPLLPPSPLNNNNNNEHQEEDDEEREIKLPPSPPNGSTSANDMSIDGDDDERDESDDDSKLSTPLLNPLNILEWIRHEDIEIGLISASTLAAALDYHYSTPLPDVELLFPWLHGIHPKNKFQKAFLDPMKRYRDKVNSWSEEDDAIIESLTFGLPQGVRGVMVIKVGDEENIRGSLVGSVVPDEILCKKDGDEDKENENEYIARFLCLDPVEGISLRNFQIQVAKWSTVSDLIVYGADPNDRAKVMSMAVVLATAQREFKLANPNIPAYKTFVVHDSMDEILKEAPHIVTLPPNKSIYEDDELLLKNWDSHFLLHERIEMSMMSSASQIGGAFEPYPTSNVWLGNTVNFESYIELYYRRTEESLDPELQETLKSRNWITFIECCDGAQLPQASHLNQYIQEAEQLLVLQAQPKNELLSDRSITPLTIRFPCSGSISLASYTQDEFQSIITLCKLIYLRSRVEYRGQAAGVLIYCNDGYTETSLLALAYVIYSTGVSTSQAWINLHTKYGRPFFSFPLDVIVLLTLEKALLENSPVTPNKDLETINVNDPLKTCEPWFSKLDGSLPSRILPHMYRGSLVHAENPEMLIKLGIKRILSVGETLSWMDYSKSCSQSDGKVLYENPYNGLSQLIYMDNIQDDGVDALMNSLSECLEFLDEGYRLGEPTLVHCRVGVSRSATVCIAEVMKRLGVGLPRAYLFVRVRRLNVIIQPNLRFMFELVKWEELHRLNGEGWLREVDWHVLCREIATMNKAYIA